MNAMIKTVKALSPADKGSIAAMLDDAAEMGCDEATEYLAARLIAHSIAKANVADDMAYAVVHGMRRKI